MGYRITEECVGCGTCADSCEEKAIEEKEDKYVITDKCVDCGKCVETCPVEAIVKE
jgi:ferredoxin